MSAVAIAIIAAGASITSAVVSGLYARSARRFDLRAQQASEARSRIDLQKRQMYEPMIDLLERMFRTDDVPTPEHLEHKRHFDTWVNVYGSDGVIVAYSRFLQALPHQPPFDVQIRLYADFLLEVRKDIGDPHSTVDRLQMLGPTVTTNLVDRMSLTEPDLAAVCRRHGWTPPWPP